MKPQVIRDNGQVVGCEYPADTPRGYKMVKQSCPCLSPDDPPVDCPMYGTQITGLCSHGCLGLA